MQLGLAICLLVVSMAGSVAFAQSDSRCPPTPLSRVQQQLTEAQDKIQLVDYAAALTLLDQVDQQLRCVSEVVPAQVLVRLNLYRGLSYFYLGNIEGARLAFLRVLTIDPAQRWDDKLGQRPRKVFLDALEQSLQRPVENVRCPLLAPGVQVYVNGRGLTQGDTTGLKPGLHFLQIRWPDGRWEGLTFEVTAGRELALPLPPQALQSEKPPTRPEVTQSPTRPEERPPSREPVTRDEPDEGMSSRLKTLTSAGVAGGGLAATLVFGGLYLQTRKELCGQAFGACPGNGYYSNVDDSNRDSLLNRNRLGAIGADVSIAVTAAATGAAVYFFLQNDDDETARNDRPLLLPAVGPQAIGLVLHHEF